MVVLTAPGWSRGFGLTAANTPDHNADGEAAPITAHWLLINTLWGHIDSFWVLSLSFIECGETGSKYGEMEPRLLRRSLVSNRVIRQNLGRLWHK